jgi:hypothetical protein
MIKKIAFLVVIGLAFFTFSLPVKAVDLTVTCDSGGCSSTGTKPLFSETNMFPGMETTKTVKAVNNYNQTREFAVEAVNLDSPGDLDKVLEIEIVESGSSAVVYSQDILANFADQYHILSDVPNLGDNFNEYLVTVSLPSWVGNDFQDKSLSFDLNLGFEMVEEEPVSASPAADGEGTGGGGAGSTGGIDCAAGIPSDITDLSAFGGINSVTLSWSASSPATHYGIRYGIEPGVYLYGNTDIGNTTTYVVGGLSAGFTYYFQVVPVNDCQAGNWSNEASALVSAGVVLGEGEGEIPPPPATGFGEVEGEKEEGEVGGEGEFEEGQEAGVMTVRRCFWWLLTILALVVNSLFVYRKRENFNDNKKLWLVPMIVSLLSFFGDKLAHRWWEPSIYCSWTWLAGVLSFLLPFLALHIFKKRV